MDINLSFIFNLLPPDIIVEVFIFTFLEYDIIFYSSRPEILNMIIYIFANFNYPFNDSIYYWHVLSVSSDSFMSGSSPFVGKTCSTLTGILDTYDPDLPTAKKIREHFVLDIDNKIFFYTYQDETEEVKETLKLHSYIKSCTSELEDCQNDSCIIDKEKILKKKIHSNDMQLFSAIKNLMEELMRRSKKVTVVNYNNIPNLKQKPSFLTMYQDENEKDCMKANLRLQKAFFAFITQFLRSFIENQKKDKNDRNDSENSSIMSNSTFSKNDPNNEEKKQQRDLAQKAGEIISKKFADCSKYSNFIINFCEFYDTIDLYKIPYTFINEFIYYSQIAEGNNLSEVDVFKLIDQFYGKIKTDNIKNLRENETDEMKEGEKDKINDDTIENLYLFSFDTFSDYYNKELRKIINREQEDDKDCFIKLKSKRNEKYRKYNRNGFFLSNKILMTYMNYENNNFRDIVYDKIFKLIKYDNQKKSNSDNSLNSQKKNNENNSNCAPCANNSNSQNENNINNNKINEEEKIMSENNFMDKSKLKNLTKKERDFRIFGSYELVEITDVIEKHFILERCFSAYGLIKFSLLNVLGVTRAFDEVEIPNERVIEILCDFCEMTKSLVRKYMNIYLKIFKTLKERNIFYDNQCDVCLYIIKNFLTKTNSMITEESNKAIKEINNQETLGNNMNNTESSFAKNNEEINKFITEHGKFFDDTKGKNKENLKKILVTIETVFTGEISKKCENYRYFIIVDNDVDDLFKEEKKGNEIRYKPMSPFNLYNDSNKLLNNYLSTFNDENINNEKLADEILSLIYYFKIQLIDKKWVENNDEKKVRKRSSKITDTFDTKKFKTNLLEIIAVLIDLIKVVKNKIN